MVRHRLPVFADLASPSTPAITAGLVGCVTPIPLGPIASPLEARPSKRERVLEQRVAILKQRLSHALHEVEVLKNRLKTGADAGSRIPLQMMNTDVGVNHFASDPLSDNDDVVAAFCRETDEALLQAGNCAECTPAVDLVRPVRKRGGRGRGGKAKKVTGGAENNPSGL